MNDNITGKWDIVQRMLSERLTVADFQWSLFVAALSSYKFQTTVRPFPPMFLLEDGVELPDKRHFSGLEKEVSEIPAFKHLQNSTTCPLRRESLELLHWCLMTNSYALKLHKQQEMVAIQQKTRQMTPIADPDYIFEIVYNKEKDAKFVQRCKNKSLLYAYHGSNIENFHSILTYGLQGHMSKNALFGEGTYLSSELSISLQYSPHGRGWDQSLLGNSLSCVAVCEMIDDSAVKCQTRGAEKQSPQTSARSKISGSEGGDIPETYYVVQNNDVIRVKYLLLYVVKSAVRSTSWYHRHKFALVMLMYAFFLIMIALYNSKTFWFFTRKYLSK